MHPEQHENRNRAAPETRQLVSSGSPFEPTIGFSRAVRLYNQIAVSGTAPILPNGETAHPGDVYGQTRHCLELALDAAAQAGANREQVIRTRILLIDIGEWQAAAQAHGELFSDVRPACTFVQVGAFIRPEWLVEVEIDLVLEPG